MAAHHDDMPSTARRPSARCRCTPSAPTTGTGSSPIGTGAYGCQTTARSRATSAAGSAAGGSGGTSGSLTPAPRSPPDRGSAPALAQGPLAVGEQHELAVAPGDLLGDHELLE